MNGSFLAAGDRNGDASIYDAENLNKIGSLKSNLSGKKNAWVEDIKISPDSRMVAWGTHGGLSRLEVGKVEPGTWKITKFASINTGISSALTHLDWS